MHRLFISLYILILAVVFGLVFTINPFLERILQSTLAGEAYRQFYDVRGLLDLRLQKTQNSQLAIAEIKKVFSYDIDLLPIAEMNLSARQHKILLAQKAVLHDIDNTEYLSLQSEFNPDMVWRLQFEAHEFIEEHNLIIGPIKLFEQELQQYPQDLWPEKLPDYFQREKYNVSITLLSQSDAELHKLGDRQRQALWQHRVVGINVDTAKETHYYAFENSGWVLKIGPLDMPPLIRYLQYVLLAFIALLFALVIFLWLLPLWRNLQSLDIASTAIANGQFGARATIRRLSPINNIQQGFNHMASRIQALINSHKDLTNAVSHELRTPLARMRFGLEMLQSSQAKQDQQRFIQELSTDIEEMDALVDELLTYARFERGVPDMDFASYRIIDWLQMQIQRGQKLSEQIVMRLHHEGVSEQQQYSFESRLMGRAISNLLSNAIRHAEKEIHVTIKNTDYGFVVYVDDDGAGVPENKREILFDLFTRGDQSRSRDMGGYGIGLSIVKQIAEWHQGRVYVEDSPLGGARFVVEVGVDATKE